MDPEERIYMLRALKKGESLQRRPRVRVSTMHAIKGGEADHVVVLRDMAPRTYNEMAMNPDDERRVWFVAATRFRERMTIVAPRTSKSYDL
jgi:superfamily I DNA/RNA helicase